MSIPIVSAADLADVHAYIDSLPQGVDSYPECQSKASGFLVVLARMPLRLERGALPGPVERLIESPPLGSSWVPTVHFQCAMSTLRCAHFPGPGGEAQFLRLVKEEDRQLFHTRMYRVLFFLLTPKRLLIGLPARWNRFNRGTTLTCEEAGARRAVLRLTHPEHLLGPEHDRGWASSMEVAIECAGGKEPLVVPNRESPGSVRFRVSWH